MTSSPFAGIASVKKQYISFFNQKMGKYQFFNRLMFFEKFPKYKILKLENSKETNKIGKIQKRQIK